ncbi:MAG: HIRAN domain-containing protein [Roseibacillus sp.]
MREFDLVHKLLRLACGSANGALGERQNSLDLAIRQSDKCSLDIERMISELGIDILDLTHPFKPERILRFPEPTCSDERSEQPVRRRKRSAPGLYEDGKRYPIAGFQYYDGPGIKRTLKIGGILRMVALTSHPHDANAVAVLFESAMLGYIPRTSNVAIWKQLRDGVCLLCEIEEVHRHGGYGAVEVVVRKAAVPEG